MEFPEVLVPLLAIVCFFGWPLLWIAGHFAHQTIKSWQEIKLKREMVARGYTAQEIVQVVGAKKGSQFANTTDVPPAKPVKQPAFAR
jgi:hypothetical protein